MIFHNTSIKMSKIKNNVNIKCWQECKKLDHSYVENEQWYGPFGKQLGRLPIKLKRQSINI